MKLLWASLLLMLLSGPVSSPVARPAMAQLLPLGDPEAVSASTGAFEVRKRLDEYEVGWELRFAPRRFRLLPSWAPDVIPVAGAMASSRSILYTYAGFRMDIPLWERWVVSPGLGTGLYYRGYGKNLGGALEFRSQIELAYRLPNEARLGLCLYHLSNAGLLGFNPGSESLVLTYSSRLRK
ncbi:MAG TPA: acyloxyacyl hydrolase [Thermoanaerobaculia bacterium]|nr:acyloxyacyl hydrolase [Thermoanaerobaculia bacterium]